MKLKMFACNNISKTLDKVNFFCLCMLCRGIFNQFYNVIFSIFNIKNTVYYYEILFHYVNTTMKVQDCIFL